MLLWNKYKKNLLEALCFQFFGGISKNGMAESHGNFILKFLQNAIMFSILAAAPFCIPTNSTMVPISLYLRIINPDIFCFCEGTILIVQRGITTSFH